MGISIDQARLIYPRDACARTMSRVKRVCGFNLFAWLDELSWLNMLGIV